MATLSVLMAVRGSIRKSVNFRYTPKFAFFDTAVSEACSLSSLGVK
jgi:hypothetical protein